MCRGWWNGVQDQPKKFLPSSSLLPLQLMHFVMFLKVSVTSTVLSSALCSLVTGVTWKIAPSPSRALQWDRTRSRDSEMKSLKLNIELDAMPFFVFCHLNFLSRPHVSVHMSLPSLSSSFSFMYLCCMFPSSIHSVASVTAFPHSHAFFHTQRCECQRKFESKHKLHFSHA